MTAPLIEEFTLTEEEVAPPCEVTLGPTRRPCSGVAKWIASWVCTCRRASVDPHGCRNMLICDTHKDLLVNGGMWWCNIGTVRVRQIATKLEPL